jgi:beta-N-acetylhexosaminidase
LKKNLLLLLCCSLWVLGCAAQTSADEALKHRIAQLLLVGFRGTDVTQESDIYTDITALGIGGVILFDYDVPSQSRPRNITSPAQLQKLLAKLQALAPVKLLVSIDQEGGKVNRLRTAYGFQPTVTAQYQGQINHPDTTAKYAAQTASALAALGFNLNFAPCVDLEVNPSNPIIGKLGRSFSADPAVVAAQAAIWLDEQAKKGVTGCIKHFPGHGSSTADTHLGIADITDTWTAAEIEPYRALIQTGKVEVVMTSHVFNAKLDAQYPATLSENIITGMLRKQLGFEGVVVTDDLAMGALVAHYTLEEILVRAVLAGADLLCLSNNGKTYDPHMARKAVDIIFKAVKDGRIPPLYIDAAYDRVMKLKKISIN